ncbi:MAG: response regulator [Magnetococcales bacterium]|nr:response regulator [Magnetococcales bacterium]
MMELLYLIGLMVVTPVLVYGGAVLASNLRGLLGITKKPGYTTPGLQLLQLATDDNTPETLVRSADPKTHGSDGRHRYWMVLLIVASVTAMTAPLLDLLDLANIVMIFLLAVVFTAIRLGRGAAALASFLSVLAFDFFFVPPRFSFAVSDIQYLVTFAVMLTVALVVGQLTAGLRFQVLATRQREQRIRTLYETSKVLSSALRVEQIIEICQHFIKCGFNASAIVFVPGPEGCCLQLAAGLSDSGTADFSIAQWSFDHEQIAGLGTNTLPSAQALYLPLKAHTHLCGVLVVIPESTWEFPLEQQQLLDTGATLIAIAMERIHYVILARDARVDMESECLRNSLSRENEQRLQEITATLAEGLYVVDREGRITFINPAAMAMLGWREGELLGQSAHTLFHRSRADDSPYPSSACPVHDVLSQCNVLNLDEEWLCRRDGTCFLVSVVASPILREGAVHGAVVSFRDITQHKQIEDALRKAKEQAEAATMAKGEFLATMSHEIRTPINAVMGLTDLVLQTELSPKGRYYLTNVAIASRSLLRIINDILDFSKMDAGRLQLEAVDFLLRDVFDHQADLFRQKAAERGIELIIQVGMGCRYALTGDYLRLEQILMNLIGNAIKFTEEGEIEVGVRLVEQQGDHVLLEFFVRDTGIGLNHAQIDTLFAPFVQADGSTTRKYGGTGLGLSICKRLVELMGGTIWVESTLGVGSVFRFTVLLLRRETAEQDNLTLPADMRALRVLIVDDNSAARHSFREFLDAFGFLTTATGSGREALAAIQQGILEENPYQLVLVDWLMPEWDGIETVRRILAVTASDATQGEPPPKIVLLTACDREEEIKQRANDMDIQALIPKPVNCSLLFDTVMELFCQEVTKVYRPGRETIDLTRITEQIGGARVLLVEDNTINQLVAREILEGVGLVVTVAGDGLEATRMVRAAPFDLVLMDIQMPVMDGYTACRQIQSDPRFEHLPIVAMTAHAMGGDRQKCLEAGMVDHVTKPIDRRLLYAALMAWIKPVDQPRVTPVPVANSIPDTEESERLPAMLPGIDVANGLNRLGNNHRVYRSLLLAFRRDFDKTATQVRMALQGKRQGDVQSAQQWVHTIKGMSGNLSARGLFQASSILGQAIQENRQDNWPMLLDTFETALNQVVDAIGTLQPEESKRSSVAMAPLNFVAITPRLVALADAIQDHRADAVEYCQTLQPLLKGTIVEKELQQLETSLEGYTFKEAQNHLVSLCNALDISLPQEEKP